MSEKTGLTALERNILTHIVEQGERRGLSPEMIGIAVKAACIQSTLGTNMKNQKWNSSAEGLYGYTNGNWRDHHRSLGEKITLIIRSTPFTPTYSIMLSDMRNCPNSKNNCMNMKKGHTEMKVGR